MRQTKNNTMPATGKERRSIRLDISNAAYAAAKDAARRAGIRCVGSKIRIDMERYYANVAMRHAKRLAKSAGGEP